MKVNIEGLDRAAVLKALYDGTSELGMGRLHAKPGGVTVEECAQALAVSSYTDYFHGRPIKCDLPEGAVVVDVSLYDRDSFRPGADSIERLRSEAA